MKTIYNIVLWDNTIEQTTEANWNKAFNGMGENGNFVNTFTTASGHTQTSLIPFRNIKKFEKVILSGKDNK